MRAALPTLRGHEGQYHSIICNPQEVPQPLRHANGSTDTPTLDNTLNFSATQVTIRVSCQCYSSKSLGAHVSPTI
jgi:hypothetical protein